MTLVLAFSRGTDLIDRLIGWLTYSSVTHVALVRGQRVIESSGHGYPKGVREVSLWDWLDRHPHSEQRTVEHPAPDTVWEIAQSQLGRGYDYGWLLRWLFRMSWLENDSWTCAELISYCCEASGSAILDAGHNTVTPRDLYMISEKE